jgi:hypothetical protein
MYTAEISRRNPSAFVFLLDQSGSMAEVFGGAAGQSKAAFLATVINRQLHELVLRCTKDDGIRDYFHVAALGYGSDVHAALTGGSTTSLTLVSELGPRPLRVEERTQRVPDGTGGLVEQTVRFPVWVDPVSNGATVMGEALRTAQDLLAEWIDQHPEAFPPAVINVTDGAATDGDPTGPAEGLRSLSTRDGPILLYNVHVSSEGGDEVAFPTDDTGLPDEFARRLFSMSSLLPVHLLRAASTPDLTLRSGSRGFAYNADPVGLTNFIEIGTQSPNDLR